MSAARDSLHAVREAIRNLQNQLADSKSEIHPGSQDHHAIIHELTAMLSEFAGTTGGIGRTPQAIINLIHVACESGDWESARSHLAILRSQIIEAVHDSREALADTQSWAEVGEFIAEATCAWVGYAALCTPMRRVATVRGWALKVMRAAFPPPTKLISIAAR